MIHVVTTHHLSDRWVDVWLDRFGLNTGQGFKSYAWLSGEAVRHARRFDVAETVAFPYDTGDRDEELKLEALAEHVVRRARPDDLIVFTHGDAFPIVPWWEYAVMSRLSAGHAVVAVQRPDAVDDVHGSFCAMKVKTWVDVGGTWARGRGVDTGGELSQRVRDAGLTWSPLERSNKTDLHPFLFGVFGGVVYHHGGGLRVGGLGLGRQMVRLDRRMPARSAREAQVLSRVLTRLFPSEVKAAMRWRPWERSWLCRLVAAVHPVVRWEADRVDENARLSEWVYSRVVSRPGFASELFL